MSQYWEGTNVNHEAPTVENYRLPSREARDRQFGELDPYAVVDDHTTEITAIVPAGADGPWSPEILMAVMRLRSRVALCERGGGIKRLNEYIRARHRCDCTGPCEGHRHPLGNLRQYSDIQYDVNDAVELVSPCGGMDEFFADALERHGGAS